MYLIQIEQTKKIEKSDHTTAKLRLKCSIAQAKLA